MSMGIVQIILWCMVGLAEITACIAGEPCTWANYFFTYAVMMINFLILTIWERS